MHYYPALPYASYAKMQLQDVADLHAFLQTLPSDPTPSLPHEVGFPFSLRQTIGVWKLLYLKGDWAVPGSLTPTAERGRYISEALAHCGECHTPRTTLGGMDTARWLGGAPNPSGEGRIPNVTPAVPDVPRAVSRNHRPHDRTTASGAWPTPSGTPCHRPPSHRPRIPRA
jgi:mono/diheme cytochrome c family protein